jgi:hypothetical protein
MYGQDPEWAFKTIARYGHPIWVTEFNNPQGSKESDQKQVEGLKQSMLRLRELQQTYNVEAAHIYELMDEPYWIPSFEAYMGLVHLVPDGGGGWMPGPPKHAYQAVKQLLRGPNSVVSYKRVCDPRQQERRGTIAQIQVVYGYCLILDRQPDGRGLADWQGQLAGGMPASQLLMAMLGSDEFKVRHATYGLSNAEFVDLMYRLLLDRGPDGLGLTSYVSQLDQKSISRIDVARSIIDSGEFRAKHEPLYSSGKSGQ